MQISRPINYLCLIVLVMGVLLGSGCQGQDAESGPAPQQPQKVVPVRVMPIERQDLTESFTLPASLEAWEDLTLGAEIAGPVEQISCREGERVEKGSVLLSIDAENLRSLVRRDRENVTVLERKLERYQKLTSQGLVSRQEIDDLENALTAARSALTTSELQLDKSRLTAPVSGIVERIYVDRGEYVDPGMAMLRLVQVDRLKAIADVPEKDVGYLRVGQQVAIDPATIEGDAAESLIGEIAAIGFAADEVTRTYRTKIVVVNPGFLRAGMIVRARFVRRQLEQVIVVPLYAVMDREGQKIVFIAEDGVARLRQVSLGRTIGQKVLVREGLEDGQQLIIRGQQLLSDGTEISTGSH